MCIESFTRFANHLFCENFGYTLLGAAATGSIIAIGNSLFQQLGNQEAETNSVSDYSWIVAPTSLALSLGIVMTVRCSSKIWQREKDPASKRMPIAGDAWQMGVLDIYRAFFSNQSSRRSTKLSDSFCSKDDLECFSLRIERFYD